MKNLSTMLFAGISVLACAASLQAQNTSSQSGFVSPSTSAYTNSGSYNAGGYQPGMNTVQDQSLYTNGANPAFPNSNSTNNSMNPTFPNQAYSQPPVITRNQNDAWNAYGNTQSNGANQWNNQNSANSTQTNPNQPYTQPSNLTNPSRLQSYVDPRTGKYMAWTDDEMAQKIRWAIRDNKNISSLAKTTEVSVKNNNVTLTGTVVDEAEKNKIASIVRQIQGVKSISNNITVTSR